MKYVIMCGGYYEQWETPKQLQVVKGEVLVERTISLLKGNGIEEIYISSNDSRFDSFGVPKLEHENSYRAEDGILKGYWLDAFYPYFKDTDKVCFLMGDVYYTNEAIKTIINTDVKENTLFGTKDAKNPYHENWGEHFAYKIVDYKTFMDGVKEVKKLYDEGKVKRNPLIWELYRYLNGLDINVQRVLDETYIVIDDETMDIDTPEELKKMNGTGFQCFHCLSNSVAWDCDYDFEDYGLEGEGIVQCCHCNNCGADIVYYIDLNPKGE